MPTVTHPMNLTRVGLAVVAAVVAYFVVGGIFFMIPAMKAEFAKYPAVFRTGDAINSVMAVGMFGTFLAIGAAAAIFAHMHPAGAGIDAGIKFGALLAAFVLGSLVIHNYMLHNVGGRLAVLQGLAYMVEWFVVGVVISLVYRS